MWRSLNGQKAWVLGVTLAMGTAAGGSTGSVLFVDDAAPPGGDGTSWVTAFRFLQDALAVAGDSVNGITEIRVAQGLYRPDRDEASPPGGSGNRQATFQLLLGVAMKGGYGGLAAGDPDHRDLELYETVLSGDLDGDDGPDFANNDENSYHVVTASGTDETAVLDGLTITAGNADGQENPRCFGGSSNGAACANDGECPGGHCVSPNSLGAGVFALAGRATIQNCRIRDNFAAFQGAGLLLKGGSHATITGCIISGNRALDNGGGMYLGLSSPTIVDCEFVGNSGRRYAGAVCNRDLSNASFVNCTFRDNTAAENGLTGGGAIVNASSSPVFTGCTFSDNSSISGYGGAMYNKAGFNDFGPSNPTLQDCTFDGNDAFYYGGAVYNIDASAPSFINCVFSENSASRGGGLYNAPDTTPTFDGCSFHANEGHGYNGGAAIYSYQVDDLTLTGCVFTGHTARAMYNEGTSATLTGCVFSNNSAPGLYTGIGSTATLDACEFTANSACALVNVIQSTAILTNCVFTGNTAGAMSNDGSSDATLSNCTFMSNSAPQFGGAFTNSGSAVFSDCTFVGNWAGVQGGGLVAINGGEVDLTRCLFKGNTADFGAAVYANGANVAITNCTLIGNWANFWGGAIYNTYTDLVLINSRLTGNASKRGSGLYNFRCSPIVTNCTFSGNWAYEDGGGIFNHLDANPILTNCILWGNTDTGPTDESAQIFHWFKNQSVVNFSCVQGWTGTLGGLGNTGDDPLFVDADGADNMVGTEDDDLRLGPGSPGIDAAVNGAVPAGVAVDLAGSPRFVDDPVTPDTGLGIPPMVDMGAFEFQLIGDVSGDGAVNVLDLIIMLLDFGDCPDPPQGCPSDVNGDGTVDTIDLIILLANFG